MSMLKSLVMAFKAGFTDRWEEIHAPPENEDMTDINRLERIENYDRQIDGYTHLIKLLDRAYLEETGTKKKAAILSKQLAALEKLNKIIAKLEKLD